MLLSHTVYTILIWVFFFAIAGYGWYIERVKKSKKGIIFLLAAIVLSLLINWTCPSLYIVQGCGKYEEKVMIKPLEINGVKLTYWHSKCYVNNIGTTPVYIETIAYGSVNDEELEAKRVDRTVMPGRISIVPAVKIDYVFENVPKSVSTKASSEIKYHLECEK